MLKRPFTDELVEPFMFSLWSGKHSLTPFLIWFVCWLSLSPVSQCQTEQQWMSQCQSGLEDYAKDDWEQNLEESIANSQVYEHCPSKKSRCENRSEE